MVILQVGIPALFLFILFASIFKNSLKLNSLDGVCLVYIRMCDYIYVNIQVHKYICIYVSTTYMHMYICIYQRSVAGARPQVVTDLRRPLD